MYCYSVLYKHIMVIATKIIIIIIIVFQVELSETGRPDSTTRSGKADPDRGASSILHRSMDGDRLIFRGLELPLPPSGLWIDRDRPRTPSSEQESSEFGNRTAAQRLIYVSVSMHLHVYASMYVCESYHVWVCVNEANSSNLRLHAKYQLPVHQ